MPEHLTIELLGDKVIPIYPNQSILEASLMAGIPHYHACGGNAKCSTCRILIKEGRDYLTPFTEKELALRQRIPLPKDVRLACQTYVTGEPAKVHRMIRDETDIRMYLAKDAISDLEYTGEEKELALFFLDIRDFTPFIEAYLPFDVIHVMRRLFMLFRTCIEEYEGKIIETAGDGFYAVFGFRTAIKDAAISAYKAGIAILQEIQNFNTQYMQKNFRHRFQVGMSVHVGAVIVGNIGIGVNNNMTVMGLPVNIAARLQSATKVLNNSFVVSDSVFQLLELTRSADPMQIEVKGLKETVTVYLLGNPYN